MSPVIEIDHNGKPVKNRRGRYSGWMNSWERESKQRMGWQKRTHQFFKALWLVWGAAST
jgi:hypothetical protein